MVTIKAYTNLEQSKKLAEILPLESADMSWVSCDDGKQKYYQAENRRIILNYEKNHWLPCWSLVALLNILNSIDGWYPGIDAQVGEDKLWQICMFSYETGSDISTAAINKELVDTCYEVIIKLKEKNLL
jgi:hypothetical protein